MLRPKGETWPAPPLRAQVRKGHGGQIRKALQLLLAAKRPYIYTGGGVILSNATAELRQLVDMLGYPVTNTLMGLGAFPSLDKQFIGMLGMHGTYEANLTMHGCDVMFNIGARFDDRVTGKLSSFAPHAKIVHADIDPAEIGKNRQADVPIVGDAKYGDFALNKALARGGIVRACNNNEREMREARERAEILLREVNHRVANSLQLVAALVHMQSKTVTDDSAQAALKPQPRLRQRWSPSIFIGAFSAAFISAWPMIVYWDLLANQIGDGTVLAECIAAARSAPGSSN